MKIRVWRRAKLYVRTVRALLLGTVGTCGATDRWQRHVFGRPLSRSFGRRMPRAPSMREPIRILRHSREKSKHHGRQRQRYSDDVSALSITIASGCPVRRISFRSGIPPFTRPIPGRTVCPRSTRRDFARADSVHRSPLIRLPNCSATSRKPADMASAKRSVTCRISESRRGAQSDARKSAVCRATDVAPDHPDRPLSHSERCARTLLLFSANCRSAASKFASAK